MFARFFGGCACSRGAARHLPYEEEERREPYGPLAHRPPQQLRLVLHERREVVGAHGGHALLVIDELGGYLDLWDEATDQILINY